MIFPVVTHGCESWTIKKTEHQRIDAFELCAQRLLRVPWTSRRSNQSILIEAILNIHWKDWCWSWNPNTLSTWCKGPSHWKRPWCWERLTAGEGDDREWDGWMASLTQWTWVWTDSGRQWKTGKPGMLQSMESQSRIWLSYWTTTAMYIPFWVLSIYFYSHCVLNALAQICAPAYLRIILSYKIDW